MSITRCLYCTHESMSDLGHAQLTRGPDSGPRNRILPDLVSSSLFPSIFTASERKYLNVKAVSLISSSDLVLAVFLEPPKRDLGTRSRYTSNVQGRRRSQMDPHRFFQSKNLIFKPIQNETFSICSPIMNASFHVN